MPLVRFIEIWRSWAKGFMVAILIGTLVAFSGCTGEAAGTGAQPLSKTGLDNAHAFPASPFVIDLGTNGYETMDIAMGALPWGVVGFEVVPTEATLKAYEGVHGSADIGAVLASWAESVQTARFDGRELTRRPCLEWARSLNDPATDGETLTFFDVVAFDDYAKIRIPVFLFGEPEEGADASFAHLSVESSEYDTVEGEVAYSDCGAEELIVRVVDKPAISMQANIVSETVFTTDELRALEVIEGYETSANCGMAGIRSFYSEAVRLQDILAAAGIDFQLGMELQLRVSDSTSTWEGGGLSEEAAYYCGYGSNGTFDWEYLFGAPRYNYPAMWDDVTIYEELGGKTVYEVLAQNKDVWKDDSALAQAISRILGASKEEVEPVIAIDRNQGVVAWSGTDPKQQTFGDATFSPYARHQYYGFLFGMLANDDGTAMDDNTMFRQAGVVFGIDIIDPTGTAVSAA